MKTDGRTLREGDVGWAHVDGRVKGRDVRGGLGLWIGLGMG